MKPPIIVTLLVVVCLVGYIRCVGASETSMPNVVVIYTDDQNNDQVSCYGGNIPTPHIDRLAAEGMRFTRYYPSSPVCTPSRYSLLTGRYATRSKSLQEQYPVSQPPVIRWNSNFEPGEATLATLLEAHGYATGMVGKWHNGEPEFEQVDPDADPCDPEVAARIRENYRRIQAHIRASAGFDYAESIYGNNMGWLPIPKTLMVHNQEWVTDGALRFIEQNADRPFFLYVSTTMPHSPGQLASLRADPRLTPAGVLPQAPKVQPPRDEVLRRAERAGYRKDDWRKSRWAGIAWLDDGVGAILDKLDELKLTDQTLVIFASDHASRGKMTCYAGPVPCMIRWKPVVPTGVVCQELVSNIDVVPTVLEACQIAPPAAATLDGRSWLPLFSGGGASWRDSLFFEITSTRGVLTKNWEYVAIRFSPDVLARITPSNRRQFNQEGLALAQGTKKHARYHADELFPGYYDDDQLYNLKTDPKHQHNLAGDPNWAKVLREMKRRMQEYSQKLPHAFGEFTTGNVRVNGQLPGKQPIPGE